MIHDDEHCFWQTFPDAGLLDPRRDQPTTLRYAHNSAGRLHRRGSLRPPSSAVHFHCCQSPGRSPPHVAHSRRPPHNGWVADQRQHTRSPPARDTPTCVILFPLQRECGCFVYSSVPTWVGGRMLPELVRCTKVRCAVNRKSPPFMDENLSSSGSKWSRCVTRAPWWSTRWPGASGRQAR